jgi:signal transduction histidine kinase
MISARVLVVEDERIVALHLKLQLTRLGYNVPAMATSGERALRQIVTIQPDVVLMDIHIEGAIDGIATAAQIPPDLQIPVIYITAYSEEMTLERARGTRPYGYLLKPFSERELHASIQMVLERRRADTALQESEQRLELLVAERTAELLTANVQLTGQTALRLQAERDLHEAQKMEALGQLTGGIAHDFNNLLTVIMGRLSRIQRRTDLSIEELQGAAATALRTCEKAATLTHRLLAFSRRQQLDPKQLNPNDLVSTMSGTLRQTLGERVRIDTVLADALWPVCVDADQLESALLNLALNARDSMPAGGDVTIETANTLLDEAYCAAHKGVSPGQYVFLAVTDTGTGMSPEVVHKAFEPFFTTKGSGQGTGLGLSQVYGFMKQSGGYVDICSEPGRGTTVSLYLPRLDGVDAESHQASEKESVPLGTGTEIILVVEDDQDVRANAVGLLVELGYGVIEAANGTAALRILRSGQQLSLLFTDVRLRGGLNGRQLGDRARQLRRGLRILFTTAYASDTVVHQGLLDPGVDLLAKPFTFPALAVKIRRALDG